MSLTNVDSQKIHCDKCEHSFLLKTVRLKEVEFKFNKKDMTLVYFVCPNCNNIYEVCVKDAHFELLKKDLEFIKRRISRNIKNGNEKTVKMLMGMMSRKVNKLRSYSKKLNDEIKGTFIFAASENKEQDEIVKYQPNINYGINHGYEDINKKHKRYNMKGEK